jgi:transposase InsO family protein
VEAARRDPEVVAVARRRRFSGSEKRRLLAEAERCKAAGTLGAFLRRERIYSSMIGGWRKQLGAADQAALTPKKWGPKPDASARQIQQLEHDNARLRRKLGRAELIIDAQKKTVRGAGAADGGRAERGRVMLAVAELAPQVGLRSACQAFALNRGFVYRDRAGHRSTASRRVARPRPPLALSIAEQDLLLGLLDSERFADVAPAAVFAILLDEGRYHGSVRTMYRLLAAQSQTGERRRQRIHPLYAKPELLAVRPNEVWSWDITKLKGPAKWSCFHLYVILDIYSRYVVGWLLAHRESAEELAEQFIADTLEKENIAPGTLTLHADRGTSMRSKPVAALLVDRCQYPGGREQRGRRHDNDRRRYPGAQWAERPDSARCAMAHIVGSQRTRARGQARSCSLGCFIGGNLPRLALRLFIAASWYFLEIGWSQSLASTANLSVTQLPGLIRHAPR